MQEPRVDPIRIKPGDPLFTKSEDTTQGSNPLPEEGETWWIVTVDGAEVRISARDRAHLVAKIKKMYPAAKLNINATQGRSVTGKKPNYKERLRQGGGVDMQPPMNKRLAEKVNQRKQLQQNKKKGKAR